VEASQARPVRSSNPTAKLKDNAEAPPLSFQRKAVQDFHSRQADKNDPPSPLAGPSTVDPDPIHPNASVLPSVPQNKRGLSSVAGDGSDTEDGIVNQSMPRMSQSRPSFLLTVPSL
jgi:hypothetical protein